MAAIQDMQLGLFSDQYAANGTVASSLCHVMDTGFKILSILKFPQTLDQDKQSLVTHTQSGIHKQTFKQLQKTSPQTSSCTSW